MKTMYKRKLIIIKMKHFKYSLLNQNDKYISYKQFFSTNEKMKQWTKNYCRWYCDWKNKYLSEPLNLFLIGGVGIRKTFPFMCII
jgi:hypothetical protein